MKNILLITAIILISGCSLFGARFDNNEYESFVRLHTEITFAAENCNNPDVLRTNIYDIVKEVEFLYTYTKHLPNNNNTFNIVTILRSNIKELDKAYTDGSKSETYCRAKLSILEQHLERSISTVATKGR